MAVLVSILLVSTACTTRGLADGELDTNETGEPETGQRPEGSGVMYARCNGPDDCEPLEFCVFPPGEAGYCSDPCTAPEVDCDPAPGGDVDVACIDIGADPRTVCGLDCSGGARCPGDMRCEAVMTNAGERRLCF